MSGARTAQEIIADRARQKFALAARRIATHPMPPALLEELAHQRLTREGAVVRKLADITKAAREDGLKTGTYCPGGVHLGEDVLILVAYDEQFREWFGSGYDLRALPAPLTPAQRDRIDGYLHDPRFHRERR